MKKQKNGVQYLILGHLGYELTWTKCVCKPKCAFKPKLNFKCNSNSHVYIKDKRKNNNQISHFLKT